MKISKNAILSLLLAACFWNRDVSADVLDPLFSSNPKITRPTELQNLIEQGEKIPVVVRIAIPNALAVKAALRSAATYTDAVDFIRNKLNVFLASLDLPARPVLKLTTSPRFATALTLPEIQSLATNPTVLSIKYNFPLKGLLSQTVPSIGMPNVFTAGADGSGGSVAIIDDGSDSSHPFLGAGARKRTRFEACFRSIAPLCANGLPEDFSDGSAEATNGAFHGTAVTGVAIGNNPDQNGIPASGVAKAADYIPINVFRSSLSVPFTDVERALEYIENIILNQNIQNPTGIQAVNISIGGEHSRADCDRDEPDFKEIVDRLRKINIPVVIGAGNDHLSGSATFPSCITSAIAVGATTRASPFSVAVYSNVAETTDLLAPGGQDDIGGCLSTSFPGGGFADACGTSVAGPHVAGVLGVFRSFFGSQFTAPELEYALRKTGPLLNDARSDGDGGTFLVPFTRADLAFDYLHNGTYHAERHDAFSDATTLDRDVARFDSNVFATQQPNEPHHVVATSDRTIWYKFTLVRSKRTRIDLTGSDFDTVLAVYTGNRVGSLGAAVASNDDADNDTKTSKVVFDGIAGQTYHVAVAGKTVDDEGFVKILMTHPPDNDDFSERKEITVHANRTKVIQGTTRSATFEYAYDRGLLSDTGGAKANVWYTFTAPATKRYTFKVETTHFDPEVGVFNDARSLKKLTNRKQIGFNDDANANTHNSEFTCRLVSGKKYIVDVVNFDTLPAPAGISNSWWGPPNTGVFKLKIIPH